MPHGDPEPSPEETIVDMTEDAADNIPREIKIKPLRRGFVVQVGCGNFNFAFEDQENMLANIARYLNDPAKVAEDVRAGNHNFDITENAKK